MFIYKLPQALSIQGITGVFYLPEGTKHVSIFPKCKVNWYWASTSGSLPETFVEEITRFSEKLAEVEWIIFPRQVEKIVAPNKLWRHY
jgi:hypothetical protein